MFSKEEYADIMDALVIRLQSLKNFFDRGQTQEILAPVCGLLRVGRVEVRYFQTPAHEMIDNAKSVVMYDCGNADETPENVIRMREPVENGAVSHFNLYPIAGEPEWCREELSKLDILHRMIFVFFGRANLITVANDLMFNDLTLKIPNLAFLLRAFGDIIVHGTADRYGAVFFNIRHFSVVNNQVGREEGTEIMKRYVHMLKDRLDGEGECVVHIGGDNFAAMYLKEHLDTVTEFLSGVKIKSTKYHAEFLLSSCGGFYMIKGEECKRPADIMEKISLTSSIAKKNPNTPFVFFNETIQENVRRAKQIEDLIPDALRNGEFIVYYQPKVSMRDYTLTGAEALCRWRHDGEMIQPFRFIPVLERSKLICELDFYMLDHVCGDIRRWMDEGKHVVKVSVNLSRVHLGDANLLEDIISIIDRHMVPHRYIEIELTETTTEVDYSELKKLVAGLRSAGISTSVDDFGIGYSSLNLIRELPWNVLKIDKSFLPDGTGNEAQKKTMLKHVIAMAQEIGVECIVEGVETMDQVMLLKENGCFLAQGFYFDKPLPVETFEQRLSDKAV